MKITSATILEVLSIERRIFADVRGCLFKCFNQKAFNGATGLDVNFVQGNHSCSRKGVLRGLHYQLQQIQGKLVRVVQGEVFDVAVDIRKSSPTSGMGVNELLPVDNKNQFGIPAGFAHAFSPCLITPNFWIKLLIIGRMRFERCIRCDNPQLGINWPTTIPPVVFAKDAVGNSFITADKFE